jgi:hypothetical protein
MSTWSSGHGTFAFKSDPVGIGKRMIRMIRVTQPARRIYRRSHMRRVLTALLAALALSAALVGSAIAHDGGPCNGTGRDYAEHHVAFLAKEGSLGAGGHVPGSHRGFSICVN